MRDRPDIRDLLETARGTLMETLLPNLPPEHRYRAHLVGAAMATAARELAAGDGPEEAERAALARLLGTDGDLETLNRAFAARLRAGAFDGSEEAYALLTRGNAARLAECNPGYETG